MRQFGLSVEDIHRARPHLVVVVITPFGLHGPYAVLNASELVVQALAGYTSLNGEAGRAPLKAPGHILAYVAGVSAFIAALAAYVDRLDSGHGHLIEAAEFEAIAAILPLLRTEYTGVHPLREGGPGTGVRTFPCSDGWVTCLPPTPKQQPDYGAVLGVSVDEWPKFAAEVKPRERRDRLIAFLAERTRAHRSEDVFLGLLRRGIVCGRVTAPAELVFDPHLEARGFFMSFEHASLGTLSMPGTAARLSAALARPPVSAPSHATSGNLDDVGWSPRPQGTPAPPGRARPLHGVTIVDCTQAWIGPFAAMLLADLGADVIKIESHKRPDVWRQWSANPVPLAHVRAEEVNSSPNYNSVNRNKRSLCLDLSTPEGKDLFLRLAANADIVMENFTPRVMDKFGLGYATLAGVNPRLVMASFSGFGKTGPHSAFKANGTSIEAVAGWDSLHRYPDGDPMVMGFYQADAITGFQMAATTLVALVQQRRIGRGQSIDGSMLEAAVGYIGEALLAAQCHGESMPVGNDDLDAVPSGIYRCRGDDRWIAITIRNDADWHALARTCRTKALDDERFAEQTGRRRHRRALEHALSAWTCGQDAESLMQGLQAAGVPAAVVRTTEDVMACPHLENRRWFRRIAHVDLGEHRYNGYPWWFEGVTPPLDLPPPRLGEHGRDLLRERLNLTESEIDGLFARGVTGAVLVKSSP